MSYIKFIIIVGLFIQLPKQMSCTSIIEFYEKLLMVLQIMYK